MVSKPPSAREQRQRLESRGSVFDLPPNLSGERLVALARSLRALSALGRDNLCLDLGLGGLVVLAALATLAAFAALVGLLVEVRKEQVEGNRVDAVERAEDAIVLVFEESEVQALGDHEDKLRHLHLREILLPPRLDLEC
eukprot:Amastigsp_a189_752.p4 type:complete len:140 gc:universal Amastigsp_a189_752:1022-603(-)